MSYRAFKRLLGETSLERKCRFLFGAFILLLITASFWLYAWRTEHLAYEQLVTTSRLLVTPIVTRQILTTCQPSGTGPDAAERDRLRQKMLDDVRKNLEKGWPEAMREYRYSFLKPNPSDPDKRPDEYGYARLKEFREDPDKNEDN